VAKIQLAIHAQAQTRWLIFGAISAAFKPASCSPGSNSAAFQLTFELHVLSSLYQIVNTQCAPDFAGSNAAQIQLHLSLRISA